MHNNLLLKTALIKSETFLRDALEIDGGQFFQPEALHPVRCSDCLPVSQR